MQYLLPLNTVSGGSALGLRFLDTVHGVSVNDGLVVTARRSGTDNPRQMASSSPLSGIYSFHTLSRLIQNIDTGQGSVPAEPPSTSQGLAIPDVGNIEQLRSLLQTYADPATGSNLIISVEDQSGRFLPQVILVSLPRPQLMVIPLFSNPARTPSAALGIVRGELVLHNTQQSGKWALITVTLGTHTFAGVADARGMFTLFVSYSGALPPSVGASQNTTEPLSWPVTINIYCEPDKQTPVSQLEPPDLLSIIKQGSANIYDGANPPSSTITRTMKFGEDLILKTDPLQPQLFIDPATQ
ncbi:hypothetical protein [Dictyobacter formicarum]|uniref:Carboxypeptidase regulatory-like domain-containing protein n=1 Tax=Dictyobacter formicarum TaxID=2778368 RepID=A0ABQ3VN17_9CHLR|nr:hypothetical protein [Dictyobacter formicarum]GHO87632.1 hypothetical protein KSZ_56380 [Dictyobacter formicarum]